MRLLVTGGHGFIGSHVLRQLVDAGHEVACLDIVGPSAVAQPVSSAVTFFQGDVTDPVDVYDAIVQFNPQRIIHLASLLGRESEADPRAAFDVNVGSTVSVLRQPKASP
jgi:nucleoside-diphosphate-sugar epimerase